MHYHTNLAPSTTREAPDHFQDILHTGPLKKKTFYFAVKRVIDVTLAIIFIVGVMSWLLPLVALLIIIDSKGPVFFVQRRTGFHGKNFTCLKFRTMVVNEEADEKQAEDNDQRITTIGAFLRRTNIDEFPQFFNVLLGNMSMVGPRPHMISDCTRFSFVIPSYKFRSMVKPGITGLAQVKGFHGPTLDYESIFNRYHWDAEYVRHAGFRLDIMIMCISIYQAFTNFISLFSAPVALLKKEEAIIKEN
jgi:putative colanic acid biosynthesis UDP-glucose lipid carrier transferase